MKKASVTIEISLLMPFILVVLVFLIYMGYFMHDKCVITKACMSSAIRGGAYFDDKNKAKAAAEEALNEVFDSHLILNWEYGTNITVGDEVTVDYRGKVNIPGEVINWLLSIGEMDYKSLTRAYRRNPSEFIRKKRKAGVGY